MSKGSEETVEYVTGLTPRALIVAIILALIALPINALTWWGIRITLEPMYGGRIGAGVYMPFGFVWLLLFIFSLVKKGLSSTELVFILTMTYIIMDAPFIICAMLESIVGPAYFAQKYPDVKDLLKYVPDMYCPKDIELVRAVFEGGIGIPGGLYPYITLLMFIALLYLLSQLFIAWIIKEQYIEVEKLPFPGVLPVVETLRYNETAPISNIGAHKVFYVGLIIGFLTSIPFTLNYIIPIFPVYAAYGQVYLKPWRDFIKGLLGTSEWWMFISADLVVFLLAPLDISFSVTIWTFFVSLIWPAIAVATGLVPFGRHPGWTGPLPLWRLARDGAPLALGFWAIVFGSKIYWRSFKGALTKGEGVKPGKLPMIIPWVGLIIIIIIYSIMWLGLGAIPSMYILMLVLWFFMTFGYARIRAETGQWCGAYTPWGIRDIVGTFGIRTGALPSNPYPSTNVWATMASLKHFSPGIHPPGSCPNATWGILETIFLGSQTKMKERDLFIAQLIAVIILVFTIPLYLSMLISLGGANKYWVWYLSAVTARNTRTLDTRYCVVKGPELPEATMNMIFLAFIVVGILWFMRLKFPWFMFTPVALWAYSGMWFLSAAPAFVIKVIVLKVFGVRTYEKYVVPITVGYMVGLSLGAVVGVLGLLIHKAPWAA